MIRVRLSAALAVRDGYTGKPMAQNAVGCILDGQVCHPGYRSGGYLIFTNLAPGVHTVVLHGGRYRDEKILLEIPETGHVERNVTLKPAPDYPFYSQVTQLCATLAEGGKPAADRTLWVAAKAAMSDLKLAQDTAEAGSREVKVYFRGGPEGRFPGNYLIIDGKNSEVVAISGAEGGHATLDTPLRFSHKRGAVFYPAQEYHTDDAGQILAFFREPVPAYVLDPSKACLTEWQLIQGINQVELGQKPKEKE